jgi:hypothetical protein
MTHFLLIITSVLASINSLTNSPISTCSKVYYPFLIFPKLVLKHTANLKFPTLFSLTQSALALSPPLAYSFPH